MNIMKKILNFLKKNKYFLSLISVLVLVYIMFDKLYLNKENYENNGPMHSKSHTQSLLRINKEFVDEINKIGPGFKESNPLLQQVRIFDHKMMWVLENKFTRTFFKDAPKLVQKRYYAMVNNYKKKIEKRSGINKSISSPYKQMFLTISKKDIESLLQSINENKKYNNIKKKLKTEKSIRWFMPEIMFMIMDEFVFFRNRELNRIRTRAEEDRENHMGKTKERQNKEKKLKQELLEYQNKVTGLTEEVTILKQESEELKNQQSSSKLDTDTNTKKLFDDLTKCKNEQSLTKLDTDTNKSNTKKIFDEKLRVSRIELTKCKNKGFFSRLFGN